MSIVQEIDLTKIVNESHENKWVALARDYSKVVAAAPTLRELVSVVDGQDVVFHRVLPRGVSFIGAAFLE